MKEYDINQEHFMSIKLNNTKMLLSYGRIPRQQVPQHLFCYDIQSSDDGFDPANIISQVMVNHWGTLISHVPIEMDESGWYQIKEDEFEYMDTNCMNLSDYLKDTQVFEQRM